MNSLLRELEALKIKDEFHEENLWAKCNNLIQVSYVPKINVDSRPCEEEDFREYRQIVDKNFQNIKSILQHIIYCRHEGDVQVKLDSSIVKTCTINLLLLVGEQHEQNVWNTTESVSISKDLTSKILELYRYQSISQLLMEQDNFTTVLLTLRPKLLKDTWKAYPAAVASYKWILYQIEKPALYNHISDVLPTTLIIIDDYVPENIVLGLECLYQIIEHSHLKKGLIDAGYVQVIFHALECLSYQREAKYVILLYKCLTSLLAAIEHWNNTLNIFEWTKRDDVLAVLLDNMEMEQNAELRCVYMLSLPQLLTNIGCAKWCDRLVRTISEYCEHHTDLKTLKATLETAKTFLMMFDPRVPNYCVPLYTTFLKLYFDLTKTPVFDMEIRQNLDYCMSSLSKSCRNVGYAVLSDYRLHSATKDCLNFQ